MPSVVFLVSFAGHDLTAAPFRFERIRRGGFGDTYQATPIETEVPGRFATFVRGQPKSKDFTIECFIDNDLPTFAGNIIDAESLLYSWFDAANGPGYLVVFDGFEQIRLLVLPQKISVEQSGHYVISFHASNPVWESVTERSDTHTFTATGQTHIVAHTGNTLTYPRFTITPTTPKSNTLSWTKRRRIVLANASEYPMLDHTSPDGYPIEISGGALTTPGNDYRVILNGREQYRWVNGNKVWANMELRARLTATLARNMNSSITSLTVNNFQGFGGWPERNGFFLIDNEAIQYTELTPNGATGLQRGALNTSQAAHNAGATLYWIQYPFFDYIYDFSAATNPAPPDSHKPVIDLALSSNSFHQWSGPFFTNGDVRSRSWERTFVDDGPASQRIRQYNGFNIVPTNPVLAFEDQVAAPNKPAYNNARMSFPVPIKIGSGTIQMTQRVDATLELNGYVIDVDGNESRLFFTFNTAGSVSKSYAPNDLVTSLRLDARVGAISGDLDTTPAAGSIVYFTTQATTETAVWTNPLFNKDATSGIAVYSTLSTPVKVYPGVHFAIDGDTEIDGFVAYLKAGTTTQYYAIYTDNGGRPGVAVAYGTFASTGSNKLVASTFSPALSLPSGEYWCMIIGPAGAGGGSGFLGSHSSRTSATTYYGAHRLPDIGHANNMTVITDTGPVTIEVPDTDAQHFNQYSVSPIFGVLSKTTQAQNNSPQQTGNAIWLDDIKAFYDTTRTPLVKVQAEEDLYLLDAVLRNNTTGDELAIFALVANGQSIEIDCLNRTVTDNETGLPIPFAVVPSNPDDWMYLVKGDNTLLYTEAGAAGVQVETAFRRAVN